MRFLSEDPWQRLAELRGRIPNICLQMLLRGRNLLGYEPYPDRAVRAFVAEANAAGVDIFRIFDALNNIEPMRAAIESALECGAVAETALCYTGDLSDPGERLYTLDYYLRLAERIVAAGAHVLAIKDMAGLLRAPAARTLVTALRERFGLPVHLHTHDTAGGQLATYLAAIDAGVDAVDGAAAPLAGMTSQPALSGIVAATAHTERASEVSLDPLLDLEPYWTEVRATYAPFETGLLAPTGRVYRHEMPGGQLSNLRQQAEALGLGDRFEEVELAYARANEVLGHIVKVTPTSKVVGDLALFVVSGNIDWQQLEQNPERFDLPDSVLGYLRGNLGEPARGLPQPFADLMFPAPYREFQESRARYSDVSVIPTRAMLYGLGPDQEIEVDLEPGVRLVIELEAVGDADERGMRTVVTRVNGQLRTLDVRDESITVTAPRAERADPRDPEHVAAPLAGVVTMRVSAGETIAESQPLAVLEAMKMESTITAPRAGRVVRIAAETGRRLEQGDLILVLASGDEPAARPEA
jgi:pyruvate carboxylase